MKAALPLYKNLYTEAKFNGEALTYPTPRGEWAKLHQTLSHLGSVQIENIAYTANWNLPLWLAEFYSAKRNWYA